jgi:serine/threonine-protein kinase SRPK3
MTQLWDLFQPKRLFPAKDSEGRYSEAQHLAEMISVMGPPPVDLLRRAGEKAEQYWEPDGQ